MFFWQFLDNFVQPALSPSVYRGGNDAHRQESASWEGRFCEKFRSAEINLRISDRTPFGMKGLLHCLRQLPIS